MIWVVLTSQSLQNFVFVFAHLYNFFFINTTAYAVKYEPEKLKKTTAWYVPGSFRLHAARKHNRDKNSRNHLEEKAKCQPWIIQNLDEEAKIG
jgi:hypothetical protein